MKLEKVTKEDRSSRRWYDDACGTALAMELVGERWSMLIVRELMFGARRFGEIKAALNGISANVLTQRLEGLEAAHILRRVKLPSPANVQVYELTPWGYQAEEPIKALAAWAARSPDYNPLLSLSAASMMMSLRVNIDRERARKMPVMTVGFTLGTDSFLARLADGELAITRGVGPSDVHFAASARLLANLIYGKWPLEEAESAGELVLGGDRLAAGRFIDLFHLPAKAKVE